jgi:uncharacterized damage-inducible protein DinB
MPATSGAPSGSSSVLTERELAVGRLGAAAEMLRALTDDVTPEQRARPPRPGEWSIVEVVRHLVEGDCRKLLPRLQRMLAETRPVFDRTDGLADDGAPLPALVERFGSSRAQVTRLLEGLDEPGWQREGVSPTFGALTVEAYALRTEKHDTEHLRQIHDVRARLGLRPKRCEARAPLPPAELAAALAAAPGRLRAVGAGLSEAQRRRRPEGRAWCLNEIMAHLLHVETELFQPRLRRMLAADHPRFPPFSPASWENERDHSLEPFDETLQAFEWARAATLDFLRTLPEPARERVGISGVFGPMTLQQYATHIADHDIEHLAQMARARGGQA